MNAETGVGIFSLTFTFTLTPEGSHVCKENCAVKRTLGKACEPRSHLSEGGKAGRGRRHRHVVAKEAGPGGGVTGTHGWADADLRQPGQSLTTASSSPGCENQSHTVCDKSSLGPLYRWEAEGMGGREHRAESVAELGPGPGGMLLAAT